MTIQEKAISLIQTLDANYRIIYRVSGRQVDILAVLHAARIFEERDIGGDE